jgi:hypothetical protein
LLIKSDPASKRQALSEYALIHYLDAKAIILVYFKPICILRVEIDIKSP